MKKINVLSLAAYIIKRYTKENSNNIISEMKMHRLLYFAQRECLMRFNMPFFDADFYAQRFGPILHEVRNAYGDKSILTTEPALLTTDQLLIIDYIFSQYSKKSAQSLSRLTRGQTSWQNARFGISEYSKSDELMLLDDIMFDATQQLNRRNKLICLRAAGIL